MSYTSTSVSTYTRTHTATHLSDVILGSIADILASLGIDATRIFADWDTDQRAIAAWIEEGSLSCVALECHRPTGEVAPIFEFPVSYAGTGEGDRKFTADRAALARYLAKLQTVPRGTTYRLFCSYNQVHSSQPGWSTGARASTSGMRSYSFGTLAAAPHASASLRYFVK
jgi:Bacterial HORMA domain 2